MSFNVKICIYERIWTYVFEHTCWQLFEHIAKKQNKHRLWIQAFVFESCSSWAPETRKRWKNARDFDSWVEMSVRVQTGGFMFDSLGIRVVVSMSYLKLCDPIYYLTSDFICYLITRSCLRQGSTEGLDRELFRQGVSAVVCKCFTDSGADWEGFQCQNGSKKISKTTKIDPKGCQNEPRNLHGHPCGTK